MALDKFPRRNTDPERHGVNAPLRAAEPAGPLSVTYPGGKSWELHPHDSAALVREGRPFLPLGVYARRLLLRRDADVGRLMLSMASHRANTLAFDLLPGSWAPDADGHSLQLPWTLDRVTGLPQFERLYSGYFSRLDVLLHALTESDIALLLRLPSAATLERLKIPPEAWTKYLAELALRVTPYRQVAFAADVDGYAAICRALAPQVEAFRSVACLDLETPTADAVRLSTINDLVPRPRLLWLHSESLLTPHFGVPGWTGPVMHSYTRPSSRSVIAPVSPVGSGEPQPKPAVPPVGIDPAALAAVWDSALQNAGVLWGYTDVAIFQSPLRDLAPMQGIARVFEDLRVEWTGLSAARHLFAGTVIEQPQAVISRTGVILGFFPSLHAGGLRAWLQPVAHKVVWYKPLEGQPVYTATGIVGNSLGAVAVPVPAERVGQAAVLALVPEN